MATDPLDVVKHEPKRGVRTFYKFDPDLGLDGAAGFEIENKEVLLQGRRVLGPPSGHRGFPDYPEPPHVPIDEKLGRSPVDLEEYHSYWLISCRMQSVLKAIAADGIAF